ncbi:MAG: hypothetical protein Q4C42_01070 [Clostridia bacterium]|nr:hypothetical protein [Clostridia bacterium]
MKTKSFRITFTAIALVLTMAVAIGGGFIDTLLNAGELVTFVDEYEDGQEITDDDTPLAAPKVTTKKTTKTTYSTERLAKRALSTKQTTTKRTVKRTTIKSSTLKKVRTETTTITTTVKKLTRNSFYQKNTITVNTTVKTTTTDIPVTKKSISNIAVLAPKAHKNVLDAYNHMKFSTKIDSTVYYSGRFDAATKSIILQRENDDAVYHELGHYVSFMAGNADVTKEFKSIFEAEKSKFKASRGNTTYILQSSSEYFADSYQDYVENPAKLKAERPLTYNYVQAATAKVTIARADTYLRLYNAYWSKL